MLHSLKNYKDTLYCFVCMECCQGSSLLSWVAVLLPESECKGTAFFHTTKLFRNFFLKNFSEKEKLQKKSSLKMSRLLVSLKHSAECRKRMQSNGENLNLPNILNKKIEEFLNKNLRLLIINILNTKYFFRHIHHIYALQLL